MFPGEGHSWVTTTVEAIVEEKGVYKVGTESKSGRPRGGKVRTIKPPMLGRK